MNLLRHNPIIIQGASVIRFMLYNSILNPPYNLLLDCEYLHIPFK